MQIVCRPSLGMNTASTEAGFCEPVFSFPLFSVLSVFSVPSALNVLTFSASPSPNKYRTDPSAEVNLCFTSGKATRAPFDSRSRSASGKFVICATSNFLSAYSA